VPRKYRPPAKRRGARRTTVPYAFESAPEDVESLDSLETEIQVEEPVITTSMAHRPARTTAVRHLNRDYGYVRAEVVRIVVVAGFLIIILVITSILRG